MAVGLAHLVGKIGVVAVYRIDHAGIPLANVIDAGVDRVVLGGQARHFDHSLRVPVEVALHRLRRQVLCKLQLGDPPDIATVGHGQGIPGRDHVVRDLRVHILERIPRLQGRVRFVRAGVRDTLVALVFDPYPAGRVLDRNLKSKLRSRGLQDLPRDLDVDELDPVGDDSDGSPLPGRFERTAQQGRGVVRFGLADLGVDALLGQSLFVIGQLRGNSRVEGVHSHVEPLVVGYLPRRLDRVHFQQRLGLFHDAATEHGEHHDTADNPNRSPGHLVTSSPAFQRPGRLRLKGSHRPCAFFL